MTERLLLTAIILAIVLAVTAALRFLNSRRVTRKSQEQLLDPSDRQLPQIVSFFGRECSACDKQKAEIELLLNDNTSLATVRYVDAVAECELALRLGVIVVPATFVTRPDGRIISASSGFVTRDHLRAQLAGVGTL